MPELSVVQWMMACAGAVVLVSWLLASFLAPGAARSGVAWFGTTGLFVLLFLFFLTLSLNAWEAGNTVVLVAFGFLCALFACGLLVSTSKTVAQLRSGRAGSSDVIH